MIRPKTMMPMNAKTYDFLADYAATLLGCGATCIRIEKNLKRLAAGCGVTAQVQIMPAHVTLSVSDGSGYSRVISRPMARGGINFDVNARLSRLSWAVADGHISADEAIKRFQEITTETGRTGQWQELLLASVANTAFCRLFGGDPASMLLVFAATLVGYRIKQVMIARGRDVRLAFLAASFFSASISAAGHVFHLGGTPEIAVGTSVLYLIPGVPYINAVSDLIDRHYLCAFGRFTDACVLTACLSAGLCAGMYLLGLYDI